MLCLPFFVLGYYTKDNINVLLEKSKVWNLLIAFFFTVIIALLNAHYFNMPDIYSESTGNILLFFCSSILGIYLTFALSKKINNFKILEFIGQNSIIFYSIHSTVYKVLNYYIFDCIELPVFIKPWLLVIVTLFIISLITIMMNKKVLTKGE